MYKKEPRKQPNAVCVTQQGGLLIIEYLEAVVGIHTMFTNI